MIVTKKAQELSYKPPFKIKVSKNLPLKNPFLTLILNAKFQLF